ncbi:MAG: DNA-processing protein DprA [Pseudonocardiaceae bacterium]
MDHLTKLELAIAVTRYGSPSKINTQLRRCGVGTLEEHLKQLDDSSRQQLRTAAEDLMSRDVTAVLRETSEYPTLLDQVPNAPPVLFCSGQLSLLSAPSVGMCGSRRVSDEGLRAATICGSVAASHGLLAVSGYARGVDMAAHVSALESGGTTIIVLPEGINHFSVKREIASVWDTSRTLVVSQFSPTQTWNAGGAMARNSVIIGLSRALVVIEAGERGGTLSAGQRALELGRRVIALQSSDMSPGNDRLLESGAIAVSNAAELSSFLHELRYVADEPTTSGSAQRHQDPLIPSSWVSPPGAGGGLVPPWDMD